jgi:hypothetical protein
MFLAGYLAVVTAMIFALWRSGHPSSALLHSSGGHSVAACPLLNHFYLLAYLYCVSLGQVYGLLGSSACPSDDKANRCPRNIQEVRLTTRSGNDRTVITLIVAFCGYSVLVPHCVGHSVSLLAVPD